MTSVLQDKQYIFGVRSLLVEEKMWLMKKDLADVLFFVLTTDAAVTSLIQSDRRVSISVQINLDNMLKK